MNSSGAVCLLDSSAADRLRHNQLTYAEVGASLSGQCPLGYRWLHRQTRLGTGDHVFVEAREGLLGWQVQLRAGLTVRASATRISSGQVAEIGVPLGPLVIRGPVRIIDVIDKPGRAGFTYGSLHGHPECGEETFHVIARPNGDVDFVINAFSRPHSLLARMASPIATQVQRVITERYMMSLARDT